MTTEPRPWRRVAAIAAVSGLPLVLAMQAAFVASATAGGGDAAGRAMASGFAVLFAGALVPFDLALPALALGLVASDPVARGTRWMSLVAFLTWVAAAGLQLIVASWAAADGHAGYGFGVLGMAAWALWLVGCPALGLGAGSVRTVGSAVAVLAVSPAALFLPAVFLYTSA